MVYNGQRACGDGMDSPKQFVAIRCHPNVTLDSSPLAFTPSSFQRFITNGGSVDDKGCVFSAPFILLRGMCVVDTHGGHPLCKPPHTLGQNARDFLFEPAVDTRCKKNHCGHPLRTPVECPVTKHTPLPPSGGCGTCNTK